MARRAGIAAWQGKDSAALLPLPGRPEPRLHPKRRPPLHCFPDDAPVARRAGIAAWQPNNDRDHPILWFPGSSGINPSMHPANSRAPRSLRSAPDPPGKVPDMSPAAAWLIPGKQGKWDAALDPHLRPSDPGSRSRSAGKQESGCAVTCNHLASVAPILVARVACILLARVANSYPHARTAHHPTASRTLAPPTPSLLPGRRARGAASRDRGVASK